MLTNLILVAGALTSGAQVSAQDTAAPKIGGFIRTSYRYSSSSDSLAQDAKPKVEWTAPAKYFGAEFPVHVVLTAPKEGSKTPAYLLDGSAFTVNGKPLVEARTEGSITLLPNAQLTLDIDLGGLLAASKGVEGAELKIGYAKDYFQGEEKAVGVMQAAEKGLDFMKLPVEDLSKYHVLMSTNRGDMEIEFWPDVAPNHVRNFLDLCYTGFYDGKTFHRVIPGFMIQGGDPTGTGTGNGPRTLKAEFSQKKHEPGVLSMARSSDPNSASCQFFIVHKTAPHLDGQYTCFGKVVSGLEVVDKIVNTKRNSQDKPFDPQTIVKATVLKIPGK